MDLYLEHLNHRLKTALCNAGSNITDNSVRLAAESISIVQHICEQFEKETCNNTNANKHSYPSFLILNVLEDQKIFVEKGTCTRVFTNITTFTFR